MTDSDSDYDFESADEGEGSSPRTKHHVPKQDVQPASQEGLVENGGGDGDGASVVMVRPECDTAKDSKMVESSGAECDDNDRTAKLQSDDATPKEELLPTCQPEKKTLKDLNSEENKDNVNKVESDVPVVCEKETREKTRSADKKETAGQDLPGGNNRTCEKSDEKQNNLEFATVLDKMSLSDSSNSQQSSGWGWGSWGMSVLSTATSSVSTFTSQVGEGLTTVLEGVESTFGAPSPEELAKEDAERLKSTVSSSTPNEKSTPKDAAEEENQPLFMGLITGVSGVIEKTSTKVLNSSLDTLEFLGKKTMDVLQENDPGLKKKRSLFEGSKPNLSEALREAKQKAESEDSDNKLDSEEQKIHYAKLFDDFQGLVHLEALEMLSKQSEARLPSLTSALGEDTSTSVEAQLNEITNFCELEEDSDDDDDDGDYSFTELLNKMFSELPLTANPQKLLQAHEKSRSWLENSKTEENGENLNPKEMHAHALESLAELTAKGVEVFHKMSELILASECCEGSKSAELLSSIAKLICKELNVVAAKYGDAINIAADTSEAGAPNNSLITEVFLEASNSNFYIRDALKLTSPVLQAVVIENLSKASERHH